MKSLGIALALIASLGVVCARSGEKLIDADADGRLTVYAVAPDVLRIEYEPTGVTPVPSPILDLDGLRKARPVGSVRELSLKTSKLTAELIQGAIRVETSDGQVVLRFDRAPLSAGAVKVSHAGGENLYGMRGYSVWPDRNEPRLDPSQGLLRNNGAPVAAGAQGDGGAPVAFTNKWGLYVDSIDGDFVNDGKVLQFRKGSRKDVEAYVILGPPKRTMEVLTGLTGHPPMMPKWSLGFMNSQWGSSEPEVDSIVEEYRRRQIPIDAFILDFDFKAWGEDDYGEFRWNSTNGKGNYEPDKFPDGQSGKFAKDLLAKGVRLVGIMKPRILTQNTDKTDTKAAAEAFAHNWFLPNRKPYTDYFSHRLADDLDFSKKEVRQWYWDHAEGLYKSGIAGWWNDEADSGFDSLGFFHMQQSLYEGQRSITNERVWSINRNWYLGAQRYAFGTWSGDIDTGFKSLAAQTARMLTIIDLDQPHWSMDSGGFNGHPTPETYARWLEFAAVVPIMRVHNTFGEHRQPWVYGPIAEAAAKKAIQLRYQWLPYLYSCERAANETGVGIVRPLFWEFPDDPLVANITDSWMVGDAILASPVLGQGQTMKSVYLPAGAWFDYATGQSYTGGQTVQIPVDSQTWSDLPLFVRGGSIVATGPILQSTNDPAPTEVTLDVWPDESREAKFRVYDDDGHTYAYEKGTFFIQNVAAKLAGETVQIEFSRPAGRYRPATTTYRVRIHRPGLHSAQIGDRQLPVDAQGAVLSFSVPTGQAELVIVK
jgi:alpha-glucosidase (family GH31 glycosyl hydrolase)